MIEEIPYIKRVPHGRIDYKLTLKSVYRLVPYLLWHTNEIEIMFKHMDRLNMDKRVLKQLLDNEAFQMLTLVSSYYESLNKDSEVREVLRLPSTLLRDIVIEPPLNKTVENEFIRYINQTMDLRRVVLKGYDLDKYNKPLYELQQEGQSKSKQELKPQEMKTQLMKLPKLTPQQIDAKMKAGVPVPPIQEIIKAMVCNPDLPKLTPQQIQKALSHLRLKPSLQEIEDIINMVQTQTQTQTPRASKSSSSRKKH